MVQRSAVGVLACAGTMDPVAADARHCEGDGLGRVVAAGCAAAKALAREAWNGAARIRPMHRGPCRPEVATDRGWAALS